MWGASAAISCKLGQGQPVTLSTTLHRMIFGSPITAGKTLEPPSILALTSGVTTEEAALWRSLVNLDPIPAEGFYASQAIGIFNAPADDFLLARTHYRQDAPQHLLEMAITEYILLPGSTLRSLSGDLTPLLVLCHEPIPPYTVANVAIEPYEAPAYPTWSQEKGLALLRSVVIDYANGDILAVLSLLGAALHERGLQLCAFPADWEQRALFVMGLMQLLPGYARADLTFATHVRQPAITNTRIVFSESTSVEGRWAADWARDMLPGEETLAHPYIRHLSTLWSGDITQFFMALREMDVYARPLMYGKSLQEGLDVILERHLLDQHISAGGQIAPEKLFALLTGSAPPQGELRARYIEMLLDYALETRDAEARRLITTAMETDPALDQRLWTLLNARLETGPDAVYAFIRSRMSEREFDQEWVYRLRAAAVSALQVAIADSDRETLVSWLRLISREPANYDLNSVLNGALLAAAPRAYQDSELALQLLTIAIRRAPSLINTLLADKVFIDSLPEQPHRALQQGDYDALMQLEATNREVFLLVLAQAISEKNAALLTPVILERLWGLTQLEPPLHLPDAYHPILLFEALLAHGADWLPQETLEQIMVLLLASGQDAEVYRFAAALAAQNRLLPALPNALQRSTRGSTDILDIVGQIKAAGHLSQQQALDVYSKVLIGWEWRKTALPVMEQITRMIQNNPKLDISRELLWRLLDVAAELKTEQVARVTARRIFSEVEKQENDEILIDMLQRLDEHIQWNVATRQQLTTWWRAFARGQSLARLQRLDKVLEGRRSLEDVQQIVQTVVAVRKLTDGRTLEAFARDVATAYDVLQAFSESFDPTPKHALSFDQDTVREELDQQQDALETHERNILANNLKELATLIAEMGDSRTKGSLVRRGADLNRQLMTGEQQPQSAVDVMKWLSGYLDGTQDRDNEDAED